MIRMTRRPLLYRPKIRPTKLCKELKPRKLKARRPGKNRREGDTKDIEISEKDETVAPP